jgi:hypothetical protein
MMEMKVTRRCASTGNVNNDADKKEGAGKKEKVLLISHVLFLIFLYSFLCVLVNMMANMF